MQTTTKLVNPYALGLMLIPRLVMQLRINTQGSTHWDGLRHYPYQKTLQYYNGVIQDDISGPQANKKLGIQSKHLNILLSPALPHILELCSYAVYYRTDIQDRCCTKDD